MIPNQFIKQLLLILLLFSTACSLQTTDPQIKRYKDQASRVTIIRDHWGIPHIYGKTDADAVFGLMYAQCEESFERVERNYLEKFGRLSEIEGESLLYEDLKMKLIYDTSAAIADYDKSPPWLKKLLHAFADGINYYLYKHPETKPLLLNHFEPWYPLLFTDGGYTATQTGGLETKDIENLFSPNKKTGTINWQRKLFLKEAYGSNGFAIAPSKTIDKNAMLYINPHVSFYFRTEVHMVSEEGLNAYGAVTWGQFFVFQGFNEHCGWMHTSSLADAADLYEEKISPNVDLLHYDYEGQIKDLKQKQLILQYKRNDSLLSYTPTVYFTHHGPVVGMKDGKWLSLKEQNRSLNGLIQSWLRTKAKDFNEFEKIIQLRSNCSTNTLYADDKGIIAYWHGNFIPRRNPGFNWSLPVDGSTAETEWKGIHEINETVHIYNPKQGWIQNCNSTPFSASGLNSLGEQSYPEYMAPEGENFRSLFAIKEIEKENSFSIDKLTSLGYQNYLTAFDSLLPYLFEAYDSLPASHDLQTIIKEPIAILKSWDRRSGVSSIATTLAVEWGYHIIYTNYYQMTDEQASHQTNLFTSFVKNTPSQKRLEMFRDVILALNRIYGSWKILYGDIHRYQRLTGDIHQKFDDNEESLPVGMTSALFGSLPAYETVWTKGNKAYGVAGNSFVAVVEFGPKIKARSIIAGGQSFRPDSKHFSDQSAMYIEGRFKDVFFYKEDVVKNSERTYHPGK